MNDNAPKLLTSSEHCKLSGYWDRDWEPEKINLLDLLQHGIREGLTSTRSDFNEAAGERVVGIVAEREVASEFHDIYAQAVHHAAIADVTTCALRRPTDEPWAVPDPIRLPDGPEWHTGCFLSPSGTSLRRVALVSSWSDDRHFAEARSWFSLGEVCVYGMPMQQAVIVLGQHREGKRHGYWSKGFRHPVNKKLRFRRKNFSGEGFKESWETIFREDFDNIRTRDWLQAMLDDDVLKDAVFTVTIDVPPEGERQRIVDLAKSKLERLFALTEEPERQMTGCHWPLPCLHRHHCDNNQPPNGRYGFVKREDVRQISTHRN